MTDIVPSQRKHDLDMIKKYMGLDDEEAQALINVLTRPTDKKDIRNRRIRGGGNADYIPGFRVIERLNEAFGFLWSFELPEVFRDGEQLVGKGHLSIQIPGRTIIRRYSDGTEETVKLDGLTITKEQYGSTQIKRYSKDDPKTRIKAGDIMDLGNDYKAVATDAMKKCGTEFGLFLDVYQSKDKSENKGPSESQMSAFYIRAEKAGKTRDEAKTWAEEKLGKKLVELEEQELLRLIVELKSMEIKS